MPLVFSYHVPSEYFTCKPSKKNRHRRDTGDKMKDARYPFEVIISKFNICTQKQLDVSNSALFVASINKLLAKIFKSNKILILIKVHAFLTRKINKFSPFNKNRSYKHLYPNISNNALIYEKCLIKQRAVVVFRVNQQTKKIFLWYAKILHTVHLAFRL